MEKCEKPRLVVELETERGERCAIADSYACIQFCPLWWKCESEGSPWATEDEDIPSDDSDQ